MWVFIFLLGGAVVYAAHKTNQAAQAKQDVPQDQSIAATGVTHKLSPAVSGGSAEIWHANRLRLNTNYRFVQQRIGTQRGPDFTANTRVVGPTNFDQMPDQAPMSYGPVQQLTGQGYKLNKL